MRPLPATLQGIGFMILAMMSFAGMNALIRTLSGQLDTTYMVFLRNILSLLMLLYVPFRHGLASLKTQRIGSHLWRGMIGICTMELWFYAISLMKLTQATALSFTTPIFATIFAIIFLKENAGWRRWAAILTGFAGAMLIIRPDGGVFNPNAFIVLTASSLMAVAGTLVKSLTRTEKPSVIVFYMALFFTIFSFPLSLSHWQPLTPLQWLEIGGIAVLSSIAQLSMAKAYTKADVVVLMPFDFVRLLFVSILGYFFFHETLSAHTLLGAAIILASTIYITHREMRLKQKATFDDPAITR